jgi:hypothetical protein
MHDPVFYIYCRDSLLAKTPVEDLTIKKVITSDPATIVFWNDGTKTVVKCQDPDTYSPKLGVLYALARKVYSKTDYSVFLDKMEQLDDCDGSKKVSLRYIDFANEPKYDFLDDGTVIRR